TSLRQNQANGQSSGTAPTMVFNAPVGVLQTGPGSYGVAHQQIDQGTSENLRRALEMLVKQLPTSQEDLPFDPSEVRDMIEASTTELDAPKPNALKLRSLLSGIGGVILNAPRLKDAYDTLKWAAKFVGVDLP
ncbi:MAG TPA: hypothetical protein VN809_00850, partial [Telmatospirillum sp.]|nr:hypothetical protein [Telmatospirillum sp.]